MNQPVMAASLCLELGNALKVKLLESYKTFGFLFNICIVHNVNIYCGFIRK